MRDESKGDCSVYSTIAYCKVPPGGEMLMLRTTPPEVRLTGDTLRLGPVSVTFHRTLRIPDDGGAYPLPPSLRPFPVRRVDDYAHEVPAAWREHGGVFLPMFQREAMWLSFHGRPWRPNAIKVAV